MIIRIEDLLKMAGEVHAQIKGYGWVPSRPLRGPLAERLRATWLVLCGRADAVVWPGQ